MHRFTLLTACLFYKLVTVLLNLEKSQAPRMYKAAPLLRRLLPPHPPGHVVLCWAAWSLGLILFSWGPGCLPPGPPGASNVVQCGGDPEPLTYPRFQSCGKLSRRSRTCSTSPKPVSTSRQNTTASPSTTKLERPAWAAAHLGRARPPGGGDRQAACQPRRTGSGPGYVQPYN